ncbi:MAG: dihydroorotate dehydrogenase electron transfer subunit [Candidatus Thorarchaeota archaeon]|nr:dihydroorotate dehydrogenase electron transfer subunit [Candidatus Thorarchaeota archaeon]
MDVEKLMGSPSSVQITEVTKENSSTTSLRFELPTAIKHIEAGQFVMVWVPGIDEIPMSVSYWKAPEVEITVKSIGEATENLCKLKKGDWIGIRGPFGKSFSSDSNNALLVGGGIGIAPLRPLVYNLLEKSTKVTLLIAAKTKEELVMYDFKESSNLGFSLRLATDDGSAGYKGFATEAVHDIINENAFDRMYTCGPELMMKGLHTIAKENGIAFEASLERYMKCGCGLCGTCGMDPNGELVCIDGPVFSGNQLAKMEDFGQSYRDSTGKRMQY